jgi:hypothetical protein
MGLAAALAPLSWARPSNLNNNKPLGCCGPPGARRQATPTSSALLLLLPAAQRPSRLLLLPLPLPLLLPLLLLLLSGHGRGREVPGGAPGGGRRRRVRAEVLIALEAQRAQLGALQPGHGRGGRVDAVL